MLDDYHIKKFKSKIDDLCNYYNEDKQIEYLKNFTGKWADLHSTIDGEGRTFVYCICETRNSEEMITYALDNEKYLVQKVMMIRYADETEYHPEGCNKTILDYCIEKQNIKYLEVLINYKNGMLNDNEIWDNDNTLLHLLCFADKNISYINFFQNVPKIKLLELINRLLKFSNVDASIKNNNDELPFFNFLRNKTTFFDSELLDFYNEICIIFLDKMFTLDEKKIEIDEFYSVIYDTMSLINQAEHEELIEFLKDEHKNVLDHYYNLEKQLDNEYETYGNKK